MAVFSCSDANTRLRRGRAIVFLPDDVGLRLSGVGRFHASTAVVRTDVGGTVETHR